MLFSIIYGIILILPIDFHIFQGGYNHQPAIFFWHSPIISPPGLQPAEFADPRVLLQPHRFVHCLRPLDWRDHDRPGEWPVPCWDKIFTVQFTSYPLVNIQKAMENHYFYGKIHYKWPCSIAMLNYQRVPVISGEKFMMTFHRYDDIPSVPSLVIMVS